MCGITGYWNFRQPVVPLGNDNVIQSMTDTLIRRGPDDNGVWIDQNIGIALGHRRLAIVDLTAHGHQPMFSQERHYVLTFNGEIYNYKALAKLLRERNVACEGRNDTEVLLYLLIYFGIEKTLPLLNGMFAFVFFDQQAQKLYLARDRFGEKPLYFSA